MQKKNMTRNRKIGTQILIYIILLAIWQCAYTVGVNVLEIWKPYAMPSPLGVVETLVSLCADRTLLMAVLYSLLRAASGFLIAIVIGVIVGIIMVQFGAVGSALKPLILGIQSLPSVCWVPFAILWFGLKEQAILFVVIMGSAFSVSLALENGVRSINPIYLKAARTMGATKKALYLKVIFPASLPALIAGLRQGWSFAWRALMSAEVMSASTGLGYTLILGRDLADINQVMLVMLVIIVVGICIDKFIFSSAEKRILAKRGFV